jgi:hypothetical protein
MANEVFDAFGARVTPTKDQKRITAVFTRPSDTTQYSAGDVVGPVTTPAAMSFPLAARQNGGSGRIMELLLAFDLETITTATFRLHFFNAVLTPAADNAAFTGVSTNPASYLGYVDPPILVTQAGGTLGQIRHTVNSTTTSGLPFNYQCADGGSGLWVVITALGTYTPKSAGIVRLSLTVERD